MDLRESYTPPTLTFTQSDADIAELLQYAHEITDLQDLAALAAWDQQTAMPAGASEARMHQMGTIQGIHHDRWTAPRMGELLKKLSDRVSQSTFTDADRGLVRNMLHAYTRKTRLPRSLVEEIERVSVVSTNAWISARANNDFASFAPFLQKTIKLQREVADRIGYAATPYDALLDETEPGLTTARVEELFTPVRKVSSELLQRIQRSGKSIDTSSLEGAFGLAQQQKLCDEVLHAMGYDFEHGHLSQSAHPFTTSFGSPLDVRVTVRYNEQYIQQALMAALHEGGHALYEQGVAPTIKRTPLASGASMGIHESQSRLWENAIGRSDAFWQGQSGLLRKYFPQHYNELDPTTFVRALNKVEPSLIRVEADEVTYNLHIIIRFELEKAMVNGDIAVETLPRLWNEKYQEYLGITPENDTVGILQDIHWTSGFGYFPDYTLGNLYSAQIYHTVRQQIPDLDSRLASGETATLLHWLRDHLYQLGSTFLPEEIIQRVTGQPADPHFFIDYLTDKFTRIYDLPEIN